MFDVASDGKRFILVLPNPGLVAPGIHVVLGWTQELELTLQRPK
jgi:hypothetical protein